MRAKMGQQHLFSIRPLIALLILFGFTTLGLGQSTNLIISEYIEGSSNNKYIEIFNHTNSTVDLSDYELRLFSNGSSTPYRTNSLNGSLASGAVIVYQNSSAAIYGGAATNASAVDFNGDDAITIYKVSTESYVDIFGVIGNDPGTAWTGAGGYTTVDKTLVRKQSVTSGITTNPSGTGASAFTTLTTEWDLYEKDDVSHLGSHAVDHSLPVELNYFKGFSHNGMVVLSWVTESEIDNLGFLLERRAESTEHGVWEMVADYKTNGALIGQGSVTHRTNYKFIDRNVITGQLYHYQLADVDYDGKITYHKPITVKVRPPDIKVNQAFPNPFNPVTTVKISIDLPQQLTVRVFDITGRRLKTLIDSHLSADEYTIAWDGTNRNNLPVASGVYFLQIKSHELNSIQKLLLTR